MFVRVSPRWRLAIGGVFVITQVLLACASADTGTSPNAIDRGLAAHAAADADIADAEVDAIAVDDAMIPDAAIPDAPPPLDSGPTNDASVPTDPIDAATASDGATSPPTTNPTPGSSSGTSGAVTAPEFDGSFGSPGKPNDEECAMAPGHKPARAGYIGIAAMFGLALVLRRRRR